MRRMLAWLALVGCATAPLPPPPAPRFRLGDDARPLRYLLELQVDPAQARVYGTVTIDVELRRPARAVWLNAGRRVRVERAEWLLGASVIAAATEPGDELLVVKTEAAVPAGHARLRMQFYSEPTSGDGDAFFRRRVRDRWFLFSHFEPLRARRAFPCFDEPRWKVPWRLIVHTPAQNDVVANMPEESSRAEAGTWKRVIFRETPPLPSYLVALAVGPFRYTPVASKVPLRFVVPVGLDTDGDIHGAKLRGLMRAAERRFGAFPFPKLDVLLVPGFEPGRAMENAGLITTDDQYFRSMPLITLAHELAHQWFGDLVTCAWFNDTWLNESFAELMGRQLDAEFRWGLSYERNRYTWRFTLATDARGRGRTIRAAPPSADKVMDSFDPYTYARGADLLGMLQAWMGPEAFDRALRRYLGAHAFATATTADVAAALSAEAGRDLGPVLTSYLDQPGQPIVDAQVSCAEAPRLTLRQRPLMGAGRWHIPICFAADGQRTCVLLDSDRSELPLAGTHCPRVTFPPPQDRLFVLEGEAATVADLHQLLLAGALPAGEVLRLLPARLGGPQPPLSDALALLADVSRLVGADQQLEWRRYLRRLGLVRLARAADGWLRESLWAFTLAESLDPELALDATAEGMSWLAGYGGDDWSTPWLGVLAGSPRFLDGLAKATGPRRRHAQALLALIARVRPPVAYRLVSTLGWNAAYAIGVADDRLKIAVAGCVAPAVPPRERPENAADFDELALCASLRRQDEEVRRFLSGE